MNRYYNTGLEISKNLELRFVYWKGIGYVVIFDVGELDGYFIRRYDSNYEQFYANQIRIIVPCKRKSAKMESKAFDLFDKNADLYAKEFAEKVKQDGGPKMTITRIN